VLRIEHRWVLDQLRGDEAHSDWGDSVDIDLDMQEVIDPKFRDDAAG